MDAAADNNLTLSIVKIKKLFKAVYLPDVREDHIPRHAERGLCKLSGLQGAKPYSTSQVESYGLWHEPCLFVGYILLCTFVLLYVTIFSFFTFFFVHLYTFS